jgi:ABC-type lipoprotein export system ATPase subunit
VDKLIEVVGLKKVYNPGTDKEVEVLHNISTEIFAGQFVAIIGQSGSGKSTLLNILGALDTPTEGNVFIDGVDIAHLDSDGLADIRGNKIGFVFQFHHLLDEFSCLENVLMPVSIQKGVPSKDDTAYAIKLLERVGLGSQLKKRANQMSGGQQQRSAIVRALTNRPRIVLADEPTGNLDSRSGAEVFALMREIAAEMDVAFLMVTHDDRLARQADRILRIEDGYLHEDTPHAAPAT